MGILGVNGFTLFENKLLISNRHGIVLLGHQVHLNPLLVFVKTGLMLEQVKVKVATKLSIDPAQKIQVKLRCVTPLASS